MADTSNLTNFLEDVADAIREKKGTSDEIPAANFDTEILGITTGSDTSDATAISSDILSPKTAYVKGQKITGSINSTFDNIPGTVILDSVPGTSNPAFFAVNNNYILSYDFTNHLIILSDLNGIKLDELAYTMNIPSLSRNKEFVNVVLSTMEYDVCYGIVGAFGTTAILLKIQNGAIVLSKETSLPDNNQALRITASRNHPRLFADEYQIDYGYARKGLLIFTIDDQLNVTSQQYGWVYNGYYVHSNYGYFSEDDTYYISECPYNTGHDISNTFVFKLDINSNVVNSFTVMSGTNSYNPSYFTDDLSLAIFNNKLYNISISGTTITYSEITDISYEGKPIIIAQNYLYTFSENTIYLYQVSSSGIELKFTFETSQSIDDSYMRWNSNNYVGFFSNSYMDFTNLNNTEVLTSVNVRGVKLYNPYDATANASDILSGKSAYINGGLVSGTMPNNGELNYTPSSQNQTIPEGYTSGGNVSGDSSLLSENIKSGVTIFGVEGTYEGSGQTTSGVKLFETEESMQADSSAKEGDLAVVYREEKGNMTVNTQTQYITFPETVILSEAITSNYNNCIINSIDQTGKMLSITLTPTEFQAGGYNNLGMVGVRYTSSDGITYTRTMLGGISGGGIDSSVTDLPNPLDFGTLIQCETPELWNDNMGYFMQIEENFEGLYIYKTDTGYELANTQLSLTASNELLIGRIAYGKTGIILGTFQPLDTSSDNPITASDVASGKEGFVNGEKITGTLPLFPNTSTFTVDNAGVTNNTEDSTLELTTINTLKQTLDSNLNMKFSATYSDIATAIGLTADKIKAGETILGITGTYTGEEDISL